MVSAVVPLDIFGAPTRESVVRARRRAEAAGGLSTERRREDALVRRLDNARRDADVWRTDAAVAELLDDESLATLQETSFLNREPDSETRARLDSRVGELEGELEECRRRQRALNAYAETLDRLQRRARPRPPSTAGR